MEQYGIKNEHILEIYETFQKETEKKKFDLKYMGLGLGGEVGEVLNEVKKLERDDLDILTDDRRNKIILELGDVLWYFQGICQKLGCTIEEIMRLNMVKLNYDKTLCKVCKQIYSDKCACWGYS